jgi:trans-aconitate 2-methyltransferase
VTGAGWDPAQYARFRAERSRPFHDLLALARPRPGMRVVDLGCGTGELTKILHETLQARDTTGIDASPEMLEGSAKLAGGGLHFERGDIAAFAATSACDLVFSNAALHWVDDHPALFRRLAGALTAHGQLAVQVPANHTEPTHTEAAALAAEEPFRSALTGGAFRQTVLLPETYALLLHELGFTEQHVRLQVYLHVLPSREAVVEWVKGSLLADYRARMPADVYDRFLAAYRDRLLARLPDVRPYPFPFKRILMWGARQES